VASYSDLGHVGEKGGRIDHRPDCIMSRQRRSAALALHVAAAYTMYWAFFTLDNTPAGEWVRAQKGQYFQFLTIHG